MRVEWNATRPRVLPDELCSDERESGGARILVWRQPTVQGVGDEGSVYSSRVLLPPLFFLASAAHTHQSLPALSDCLVPPSSTCIVLTTREQNSFVFSPPLPWSLAGSLFPIQQDHLGTLPHLNQYLWVTGHRSSSRASRVHILFQ